MKIKLSVCVLSILLLLSGCNEEKIQKPVTLENPPKINAQCVALIDWDSGRLLYGHNQDKEVPMASTTKIMTAIVAIEQGNLKDMVTVSKNAANTWGSDIKLKTGNQLSLKELLYGLLLKSGNDAAVAIAEHIGGSVEGFAELMNKKAKEIGANHTHFITPHGLDEDGHYTTARELAQIARYAMNNSIFREIVSTKSKAITDRQLSNTNELLYSLEGADGIKTGYTGLAGRCLVASATRNEQRLIAVALGCPTKTARGQTCRNLLEYGFKNYQPQLLYSENQEIKKIKIIKGKTPYVSITTNSKRVQIPVSNQERSSLNVRIDAPDNLSAPVISGQKIGKLIISINNDEVSSYNLFSNESSENKSYLNFLEDMLNETIKTLK